MKTINRFTSLALYAFAFLFSILIALPRAIGIGFMAWAECLTANRAGCVNDGIPTDIKGLHEAFVKAVEAMNVNIKKTQDLSAEAIETVRKEGTIHGEQNVKLKELGEAGTKMTDQIKELSARIVDAEQKLDKRPATEQHKEKSVGEIFSTSPELKQMLAMKTYNSAPVAVASLRKATIYNTTGQNQPLVPVDHIPGISVAPEQRLTVRDLIPTLRTSSNSVEWVKELLFTNNAGPQGGTASPTENGGEGQVKNESGITFQLNTTAVITLAHWIPASRQVLSDAPYLQDYIDMRLRYGLKLEEEDEMLNGTGSAGELNGLMNQATAFTGGGTNQQAIDTMLEAMTQARLSFYEPNGVILHPVDWQNILLLKDTTGRYLFGDPHEFNTPNIWGKPVVDTPSMPIGQFLVGGFDRAAQIVDREDASVRISDQHSDFFTRNLIAILCEERLALLVTRPAAIIKGAISYAG